MIESRYGAEGWRGFDRFLSCGEERHRAGLPYGDCFAYRAAVHLGVPLRAKGDDSRRTDVARFDVRNG